MAVDESVAGLKPLVNSVSSDKNLKLTDAGAKYFQRWIDYTRNELRRVLNENMSSLAWKGDFPERLSSAVKVRNAIYTSQPADLKTAIDKYIDDYLSNLEQVLWAAWMQFKRVDQVDADTLRNLQAPLSPSWSPPK